MSQTTTIPSPGAPEKQSETLRVLVIESSIEDAELALDELSRAGFECRPIIIGTHNEFLAQMPRFPFDLVLSSYHLTGWTGIEAFHALRQSGSEVPFILVTGNLGDDVAVECMKQGVTDYVLRNRLGRLPAAVSRALEDRSRRDGRNFMMQALRQSETNSLFLFANNPLPMWVLELETLAFLHVNDATVEQYGYSRMEFLQMKASDLHPGGEVPALAAAIRNESSRKVEAGKWHHRLKNGSTIDVEMALHKMEYLGYAAALVVSQNVTERKRTEEERQKLFTLVENSRDFIAVADLNDNLEYVNPAGRALLGFDSAEEVKGTHSIDYVIPGDLPLVQETVLPALRSVGHWAGELRFRHRKTGQAFPMDFVGFQITDPRTGLPRLVATVSRDITGRRVLEQQLRQAQKFEAIGQLAGGIAHDFNNVIGAILGWAELGEEQASPGGGQLQTYFSKIRTQCDRVTALVQQLLAFARRQILEPIDLDLNRTVQEVLNLLDGVIGKDIDIQSSLARDLSIVRADPAQIEQVLMNLCINSRDAMPKGGQLSIETLNVEVSDDQCRTMPDLKSGPYAVLRVGDTGTGMSPAVRERIFEPFFTTKGTGKGTGLGLATVYGIVKQHGGFISLKTEEGRGSEFEILLPAIQPSAKNERPLSVVEDTPIRGGSETILIAEDHEGIREMAETVLKSLGYRVLLANDGEDAVRVFTSHHSDISLVVLDVIMPRRNGAEAYASIAKMKPGISVIFATGYSNETPALAEIIERGVAILRKPYSPRTLCLRVREVLDRPRSQA
jgi:PAS domain S-box-containing protein